MRGEVVQRYSRRPSAIAFMARALLPSPGLRPDAGLPAMALTWNGLRFSPGDLAAFEAATGLGAADGISILYPHVIGFRLQMALLTHPAFPLPIWNALQIRNRLVSHRRLDAAGVYDLEARTDALRILDKGAEVDLRTSLARDGDRHWESTITIFYRGDFKGTRETVALPAAPDLATAPWIDRFRAPVGGGGRFGRLTGDYNGIHLWNAYARGFGFRAAFAHPQRIAGMCLARLRAPEADAQVLELWLKGPIYYGAEVTLRAAGGPGGPRFGLSLAGDDRAAVVGSWRGRGADRDGTSCLDLAQSA